ncbi:uncharacterized protein LOC108031950 isoform X2 [Drosophila biarmipes]|nr:uncharacterized protein LOC108031950 isoform X2 [Drosophila biarmipes]
MSNYYMDLSLIKLTFTPLSCVTPEMSRLIPIVLAARQPEITKHLEQYYCQTENVIESFEWDTSFIFADSSFGGNNQITTLNFRYGNIRFKKRLIFEMNNEKLNGLIYVLENFLE